MALLHFAVILRLHFPHISVPVSFTSSFSFSFLSWSGADPTAHTPAASPTAASDRINCFIVSSSLANTAGSRRRHRAAVPAPGVRNALGLRALVVELSLGFELQPPGAADPEEPHRQKHIH